MMAAWLGLSRPIFSTEVIWIQRSVMAAVRLNSVGPCG